MSSSATSESTEATAESESESEKRALGVRFAESSVGEPIVDGMLFVASSFWLMTAAVGVFLTLIAIAIWDGVMAGVIGVFGLSGIFVGLLGYAAAYVYIHRQDVRS